ncbi:MAG: 3',5'-cyclic-AMP phosphodiesterase [Methylococcaceae bacterium]
MVRILQITDLHILAQPGQTLLGVDTEASFREILSKAVTEQDDIRLVLLTGDLAQDPEPSTYTRLLGWLQETDWDYAFIPGNHDDLTLMISCLSGDKTGYRPHILLDNWQIICLDSSVEGSPSGFLVEDQIRYMEHCLVNHPECHTLIALHHHPIATGSTWLDTMVLGNKDEFLAVVHRHPSVKAVLTGHVHQLMDVRRDEVRFMATPSTCFQFKPLSEQFALDEAAPGYRWLELHEDGRFSTGVERLGHSPKGLDRASSGY